MLGAAYLGQITLAQPPRYDFTAPGLDITVSPDRTRISSIAGRDTSTFTFQTSEDFLAYQIRVVPGPSSLVSAGTQIESGGAGTATTDYVVDVTGAELSGLGEGDYIIKVFVKDLSGNWSE